MAFALSVTTHSHVLSRGLLALAFSQSGQSPDLVAPMQQLSAQGARTVAFVNDADSPLARAVRHVVPLQAGAETSVAATKSFMAQLVAGASGFGEAEARMIKLFAAAKALDAVLYLEDFGGLFRERGGDTSRLPDPFVSALDMGVEQHLRMLVAVQPFIDSSISKTVNVPADYPYEAFKGLYIQAWKAGLKGLATYRPNETTGAVLSVDAPAAALQGTATEDDPLRKQFASRPAGELEGLTSKVEFWTVEGKKSVYLTVNFVRVHGIVNGQPVVIERPVEFFVPAGQRDEGQQWISSNMRLLSMVARSGGSISKALANMCEVVWDKGPVRCGFVTREDGAQAPRFHDSEVAAIGHALQQILGRRGFLDSLGNQVPAAALAPNRTLRRVASAPSKRSRTAPMSALSAAPAGAAASWATTCWLPRRAAQRRHTTSSTTRATSTPMVIQRERSVSSGRASPMDTSGPMNQITKARTSSSRTNSVQKLNTQPKMRRSSSMVVSVKRQQQPARRWSAPGLCRGTG